LSSLFAPYIIQHGVRRSFDCFQLGKRYVTRKKRANGQIGRFRAFPADFSLDNGFPSRYIMGETIPPGGFASIRLHIQPDSRPQQTNQR
jgi:hypothetical protein